MITQSDNDAGQTRCGTSWAALPGYEPANNTFHLTGTRPRQRRRLGFHRHDGCRPVDPAESAGGTRQFRSSASSRAYELGLMSRVESDQRWGVPIAGRT